MNKRKNGKNGNQNQRPGKYLSSAGNGKRHIYRWVAGIGSVTAILLVVMIVLANCNEKSELVGVWRYDAYTEYEFADKGHGCICLDGNTHYEFVYSTKNNVIYMDFVQDYVTDCQYTYSIEGDKLTLVGGEGTAEVGKTYELTREKE